MIITLTGASGFVGKPLVAKLLASGHQLRVISRSGAAMPGVSVIRHDLNAGPPPPEALEGADAIIHLAGEPIAQRWTPESKRAICDSRVLGTAHLIHALSTMSQRPAALISTSAIGIYGNRGDQLLTEDAKPGKDWLSKIAIEWEQQAALAQALGMRVAIIRTGVVLGDGGALEKMLPPFRLGIGGKIGSGKQWMSWIHVDDLVDLYVFALVNERASGPWNGVAPNPATNATFSKVLGEVLGRPTFMPVPEFSIKLLYGEMAQVVLDSQHVSAARVLSAGFHFRYPELKPALRAILK